MGATDDPTIEIIALAALRHAIRGREVGAGLVTYRRALAGVIPGQRLTVGVEKRWRFRKTEMVGGVLLHVGFSLRALLQAGYELPVARGGRLVAPGEGDARVREGLLALDAGEWATARSLLLDALEEHPACLPAHAALGQLLAELEHREQALAHLTAAVRLGLGALCSDDGASALDVGRPTERLLVLALVTRARLMHAMGRDDEAAADLRRALAWDPSDRAGASCLLLELGPEPRRAVAVGAP